MDPPPLRLVDRAPLLEHLHDDGGRGEDEPGARDQRRRQRIAEGEADVPEQEHADHDRSNEQLPAGGHGPDGVGSALRAADQ